MRVLCLLVLGACGVGKGLGSSNGRVEIVDTEDGETREVTFDGGALAWQQGETWRVAVSSWGHNFNCEFAQVDLAGRGGRDVDRRGRHFELVWSDDAPDQVTLYSTHENVLGGSQSSALPIAGSIAFDDETRLSGVITTDGGEVGFDAFDCGEL